MLRKLSAEYVQSLRGLYEPGVQRGQHIGSGRGRRGRRLQHAEKLREQVLLRREREKKRGPWPGAGFLRRHGSWSVADGSCGGNNNASLYLHEQG